MVACPANLLGPSALPGQQRRASIHKRLDITAKSQFREAYARALPSSFPRLISTPIPHAERAALFKGPLPVASSSLELNRERSITIRGGLNRRTIDHGLA